MGNRPVGGARMALRYIIYAIAVLLAIGFVKEVRADHGVALCGPDGQKACLTAATTAIITNAIYAKGEVTYCLDARSSTYPGFRAQLEEVNVAVYARLRLPMREVPFGSGCDIRQTMPDDSPCPSGSACVYYSAWPVVIVYNYKLGYTDWKTAQAHEEIHAECTLDEHYDKVYFRSWFRTYGYWIHGAPTVMDFGTGVWETTAYDRDRCFEKLLPEPVQYAGIGRHPDQTPYVFYCNGDRRADRVTIMKRDSVFGTYWAGQYVLGDTGTTDVVANGCKGQNITAVPVSPGDCFLVNQEISRWWESFIYQDMRNDVEAGCF